MRPPTLVRVDAPPERVREVVRSVLGVSDGGSGPFTGSVADETGDATAHLTVAVEPDAAGGTRLALSTTSELRVPFFGWAVTPVRRLGARRAVAVTIARIRARIAGDPEPSLRRNPALPPAPFTADRAVRLAALAAVGALASFGGALLTQDGDAVARSFHQSDEALGLALALARGGVLFALVASALADRLGRRRVLLTGLVVAALANAVAAAAPGFEVFTASQVLTRAALNTTVIVASVAVIEDAPEEARAYSLSLFALAIGLGFGASVLLLPLADLDADGWRLPFALSAATVVLVPAIARRLRETERFVRLAARTDERGRVGEVFDRRYGGRFIVLGLVAFLTNLFAAPSSQLTNRYLTGAHDFSNSQVALFRTVTAGLPGIIGVLLAGRLAESRGRRPVAIVGLLVATAFQSAFFLGGGALLWLAPPVAIIGAACAGLALGSVNTELFPTEVRGTSNGFLLVCGVAGAAVGLLVATNLAHTLGGLGPAIALCAIAPVAAVLLLPRLPETRARPLDDVSPSEL